MSSPPKIVIYGSDSCGYCTAARMLLKRKGANYEDVLVSRSPERREEMERLSGRRSVPQIFINGQSVGGFEHLDALNRSGELDKLLGVQANAT